MSAEMPLDVQWFLYALAGNGAMTRAEGRRLYDSLEPGANLTAFAQAVLNQLVDGLAEEEAQTMLEQVESLISYATSQSEMGSPPPDQLPCKSGAPVPADAEAPVSEEAVSGPAAGNKRALFFNEHTVAYDTSELTYDDIHTFEDLPGFSDVSELSDEELASRMIFLLGALRHLGCSDLHLSGGAPPFVRCNLELIRIDGYILTAEDSRRLNTVLISPERKTLFEKEQDESFALEIGPDRFRVCLMEQKDGVSGSYRLVPDHIYSLEELGFLDQDIIFIKRLLDYNNGLVLITGPIGSGKTSTLASVTNIINEKRHDHIISIEEPIEILQNSKNCQVTQREVGRHTVSYPVALKASLREDPDVIVIGEMHDLETIENAITAAETGHLVIGTLHTGNAPDTLNRLLDVFPPNQQPQIRAMTAGSLRGVICQKLIPNGFGGVTIVYEILINTMSVSNTISEGKTFRLKSTMMISNKQGMCTFDQCIYNKYEAGLITYEAAIAEMTDPSVIAQLQQLWGTREAKKLNR